MVNKPRPQSGNGLVVWRSTRSQVFAATSSGLQALMSTRSGW